MIRSMTGYGDAELDCTAGRLRLEVKTVNHRFFNANIKTPSGFDRFEKAISDALRGQPPSEELYAAVGQIAADNTSPQTDTRGTAAYKTHLAKELTIRSLRRAVARATGEES